MVIFAVELNCMKPSVVTNIRSLDLPKLKRLMEEWGEKSFRAKQIHEWLWQKGASQFEEMSNLSKSLREKLAANFSIGKVQIEDEQRSNDGTIKYAFRLAGGHQVEGVLIPTPKRVTACISSQAGCSLSCKFCATGFLDLKHNLHHFEIFDQIQLLRERAAIEFGRPLTNIVYMGMGEPLLNYRNVLGSINMVSSESGLGMSPKRITVSTAGIAKMIKKLADDDIKFEFALSLHAGERRKAKQGDAHQRQQFVRGIERGIDLFLRKNQNPRNLRILHLPRLQRQHTRRQGACCLLTHHPLKSQCDRVQSCARGRIPQHDS